MKKTVNAYFLLTLALVFSAIGFTAAERLNGFFPAREASAQAAAPEVRGLPDFVSLAKKLSPVVVNISTTQLSERQNPQSQLPQGDPFADLWRKFYGNPRGPSRQQSLGSGFIIDRDGSILTNNHVVDKAQKIVVKLADQREFEAKVIGRDEKTDIAIIKINAKDHLPVAALGDSDQLEVGEWVMAIGNPFGLDNTVTSGIVSGKGRHLGTGPYDSFIQTDASINPGNSGGPLINLKGEVVGINTAIFSQTGGNIGIGFATPINLAREILPQLKSKGKVTRGWLGVSIQEVTPDIAQSLGLDKRRGALVGEVIKGGPAERAGVKVGDVIVEFNGKEIKEATDLPALVARTAPETQARMKIYRDKKEQVLSVTTGEMKETEVVASAKEKAGLGLTLQKVTPDIAKRLDLPRAEGLVVTAVEAGSPAEEAGLEAGDVIVEIDRKPVRELSDFQKAVAEFKKGKGILFLVRREGGSLFLAMKP